MNSNRLNYAKSIIRGKVIPGTLWYKLNSSFWELFVYRDANRFLPTYFCLERLKFAGFTYAQIRDLRSVAVDAGFVALDSIKSKYPYIEINRWYSVLDSSFQQADLYLNVDDEHRAEFNSLVQELFDYKIIKIIDRFES